MARPDSQIVKLLFGPYRIPKFQRGERVLCQLRDRDIIVTVYTNARFSWPKGRLALGRFESHFAGAGVVLLAIGTWAGFCL